MLLFVSVGFTGGGLLRVYSCSDVVANRSESLVDGSGSSSLADGARSLL